MKLKVTDLKSCVEVAWQSMVLKLVGLGLERSLKHQMLEWVLLYKEKRISTQIFLSSVVSLRLCLHRKRPWLHLSHDKWNSVAFDAGCSQWKWWTLVAMTLRRLKARRFLPPYHHFIIDHGSDDHHHCSLPTMFAAVSLMPTLVLGACYRTEAVRAC